MNSTSSTIPQICPTCSSILNRATNVNNDDLPKDNDITICFICGEILMFHNGLKLRSITIKELEDIKICDEETYDQLMEISHTISFDKTNNN